jgi:hypothetical protein
MRAAYAHVAYPWRAAIGRRTPHPLRFYADLVTQALRHGLPARRRGGRAFALVARRGVPRELVAGTLIAASHRRPRPDLERILRAVEDAWPDLASQSPDLSRDVPRFFDALALQRRAALTVFVWGEQERPLVVVKVPDSAHDRVEQEFRALEIVEPAGIGPRPLGAVAGGCVQEALEGVPLDVEPLDPARARQLRWPTPFRALEAGLSRLASETRLAEAHHELHGPLERAIAEGTLSAPARRLLKAAWADVKGLPVTVLRHRDTGPQNCLFDGDRLVGLVDWEGAVRRGTPSYDVLNAMMSYLDIGVGLQRWSNECLVETFREAWSGPFGESARESARRTASAVDVPDYLFEPLELVFFGLRIGRRLENRTSFYPTGPATAARMLEAVAIG